MVHTAISTNSIPIAFEERGDGTPIVFVHAFPLHRGIWKPLMAALQGFRRICLDLRGFGASGTPAHQGTTMADLANDVLAVLDQLHLPKAHLVGCSMGGYVLMEILRQRPSAALSLALVDTRAEADPEPVRIQRLETARQLREDGASARRSFEEGMLGKLLGATSLRERQPLREQIRTMMQVAHLRGITGALEAMATRPDSTELLAGCDLPVLVAAGQEDTLIPVEHARALAAAIPGAMLSVLPSAGHLPSLETPEPLQAALLSLWAASTP